MSKWNGLPDDFDPSAFVDRLTESLGRPPLLDECGLAVEALRQGHAIKIEDGRILIEKPI